MHVFLLRRQICKCRRGLHPRLLSYHTSSVLMNTRILF